MEHVYWCIGHKLIFQDIVRGEGCYLYDSQGRKYIDYESGVWCTPLGHSNPRTNQIIKEQVDKITHTGYCYLSPKTEEAAQEVLRITGLLSGKCVFLCSGSEAVEFGVQGMRKITGKPLLLTLADSFLSSFGSAGKKEEDEWFLLDWSRCLTCESSYECNLKCPTFQEIPFAKIGGFVFEPGSSSGLVRFPPRAFIHNVVKYIKEYQGFLQINEITTGIGRTGEWFGFQHYDILPDIVSIGKGIGNGYPVSAIAMSKEVINRLNEASFKYFQSHQNDPLGCAIAKEVIKVIDEQNLIKRSRDLGAYFLNKLQETVQANPIIKEVRGRGLMVAVEFNKIENKMPADIIYEELIKRNIIVSLRKGLNALRIDPALTIDERDINYFIENFSQILNDSSN